MKNRHSDNGDVVLTRLKGTARRKQGSHPINNLVVFERQFYSERKSITRWETEGGKI